MLQKYICTHCGSSLLLFNNELDKLKTTGCCADPDFMKKNSLVLIVHGIKSYMSQHYALDSIGTLHELNRVLDLEAAEEKEVSFLNSARTKI